MKVTIYWDFMKTIGCIIKKRRAEFALTQAELSELSKVGINTLTQIERGEGNPTLKNVEKVLKVLGMELTVKTIEI